MDIQPAWSQALTRLVRTEMQMRGLSYDSLLTRLDGLGVAGYTAHTLRNKVARGTFSAVFLAQVMIAMEVDSLQLNPLLFREALASADRD